MNYFPLAPGEALWWIPPYGSSQNTTGEFVITAPANSSAHADYMIPESWLLIVRRNYYPAYDHASHTWGDGREDSYWTLVPTVSDGYSVFANGWVNYGSGYNLAAWRKQNGIMYWRGLIRSGTIGAAVTAIALNPDITGMPQGGVGIGAMGDLWATHANGFGRIDVYYDRLTVSQGSNGFVSLAGLWYHTG